MLWSGVVLSAWLAAAPVATGGDSKNDQPTTNEPEAQPEDQPDSPDKLGGVNPARLIPRLELRQRFTRASSGDGRIHSTTLRMDVVLFRRTLLRYEMPILVQRAGGATRSGIGDIEVSLIGVVTSKPRYAVVLVGGLALDSASRPELGSGKQVVTFGGAAAWKPMPPWLMYGIVGQRLSFAGAPARPPVSQLALELGNALFAGRGDWYLLDLTVPVDLHADEARLIGQLETGHLLIGRVALFVRGGTQLLGPREIDYFVDAGVRYLFKLP